MMKSRLIVISFIFSLSVFITLPIMAAEKTNSKSTAKKSDIKKLINLSGAEKLGPQIFNQLMHSFKEMDSDIPDEFWNEVTKEFDINELIDFMIPVYDKYLTYDDIKGLIRFYESPIGKKFVSVLPQISQESMAASQKWGQEFGEKVIKRLEQKGYK